MTTPELALAIYGREKQIRKTLEELAELSVELHHAIDGRGDNKKILEEMADVEIMIGQMKLLYGQTDGWKEKKLARLEERIHGAKPATRYDWSKAPKWAQWAARDADGQMAWYTSKPISLEDARKEWQNWPYRIDWIRGEQSCILDAYGDWRDSLERRPE